MTLSPKKRGRPPTHWSDRLRVRLWYWEVRALTGLPDYELDMRFGFPDGVERLSAERPRIFEGIRTRGTVPARGAHWRSSRDLIECVASAPGLEYTKTLYESEFWGLVKSPPRSLHEINPRVDAFLRLHQLRRVPILEVLAALEQQGRNNLDHRSCFNLCLSISLKDLDYLERLTGLILLYRQADLAGNLEVIELLRSYLDEALDFFLARRLEAAQAMDYYALLVEELMFGARGVGKDELRIRAGVELNVHDPVLPIGWLEHESH
jgi:hypothetical protein